MTFIPYAGIKVQTSSITTLGTIALPDPPTGSYLSIDISPAIKLRHNPSSRTVIGHIHVKALSAGVYFLNWTVQGSLNGTNWVDLYTYGEDPPTPSSYIVQLPLCAYYRIKADATGDQGLRETILRIGN